MALWSRAVRRYQRSDKWTEPQKAWLLRLEDDAERLAEFEAQALANPYHYFVFRRLQKLAGGLPVERDVEPCCATKRPRWDSENEEDEEEEEDEEGAGDGRPLFAFEQADAFFLDPDLVSGRLDSPLRLHYAAVHVLRRAQSDQLNMHAAHSYLTLPQLAAQVGKVVGCRVEAPGLLAFDPPESPRLFVVDAHGRAVLIVTDWYERNVARRLGWIEAQRGSAGAHEAAETEQELDETQGRAVATALGGGVTVVHGPPGTGKTRVIAAIVTHLNASIPFLFKERVRLLAPTGMAAQNVTRRAEGLLTATTIHSLLHSRGQAAEFLHVCDTAIVDETSLVDLELLYHLLKKLPGLKRLVLVGDPDQLPSIGHGRVLKDLLAAGVRQVKLTSIYRVGGQEEATRQLIALGQGESLDGLSGVMDIVALEDAEDVLGKGGIRVAREWWRRLGPKNASCIANKKDACFALANTLQVEAGQAPAKLGAGDDVIVSETGLQGKVVGVSRGAAEDEDPFFGFVYDVRVTGKKREVRRGVERWRVRPARLVAGDYVYLNKNVYAQSDGERDVVYMNGDDGRFVKYIPKDRCEDCGVVVDKGTRPWCRLQGQQKRRRCRRLRGAEHCLVQLRREPGHVIEAPPAHVDLAYARTVHKFQGQEDDAILFVTSTSFGMRPMLYTGCSRWRSRMALLTTNCILRTMTRIAGKERQTRLAHLLSQTLREWVAGEGW
jgi:hypothetical protein